MSRELYCKECAKLVKATPFSRCPQCKTRINIEDTTTFHMTVAKLQQKGSN